MVLSLVFTVGTNGTYTITAMGVDAATREASLDFGTLTVQGLWLGFCCLRQIFKT
jgi:hypothetical protein